jgi:hypothetical protein
MRNRWPSIAVALIAFALVIGFVAWQLPERVGIEKGPETSAMSPDSDGDGIQDDIEIAGWVTQDGDVHRTDPHVADSDGDGLDDGEEAGPSFETPNGETRYVGLSNPNKVDTDGDGLTDPVETGDISGLPAGRAAPFRVSNPKLSDSDGDGIGDGDEFFFDMNPLKSDTDGDGLSDVVELTFGSDPTHSNPDDDSYPDQVEYERGSNPLSYDMTGTEKLNAGEAGLTYGDCYECAINAGLRIEQVESAEYLAGHFASGLAVYGDIRDVVVNSWKLQFFAAGVAAIGLLPFVGDSAKGVAILTKFGRRGDRAEDAVRTVTEKAPLSERAKTKVLKSLRSRNGRLPREMTGGPKNYVVYTGPNYVGITSDFERRSSQHARAGRDFTPRIMPGATNLSRGEARAIEQACIAQGGLSTSGGLLQNQRNSVDPKFRYYKAAVEAGEALLKKIDGSCPISARS